MAPLNMDQTSIFRICVVLLLASLSAHAFTIQQALRDNKAVYDDLAVESSAAHDVKSNTASSNDINGDAKNKNEAKELSAPHDKVTTIEDRPPFVTTNKTNTESQPEVTTTVLYNITKPDIGLIEEQSTTVQDRILDTENDMSTTTLITHLEPVTTTTVTITSTFEADTKTEVDNATSHPTSSVDNEHQTVSTTNEIPSDKSESNKRETQPPTTGGQEFTTIGVKLSTSNDESETPFWKKYTTIDRKPNGVINTINDDKSPISDTVSADDITLPIELLLKDSTAEYRVPGEVLNTKRGGFLDLSPKEVSTMQTEQKRPTEAEVVPKITETSTVFYYELQAANNTSSESYNTQFDETIETKSPTPLLDNQYNTEEHPVEPAALNNDLPKTLQPDTDDLSVKPISKPKTFPVSPNYKKMKKIDVVPTKPYIRDPDDNSWRNESLSTLGIVFKAKNSTKTFTQVLKNKTETELSNSAEKEQREQTDHPELRTRLEKLAEERKKKKKSSGESTENDFEDYSSAPQFILHSSTRAMPTKTPLTTPAPKTTTSSSTISITTSKTKSPPVLTTEKPKKRLNILEYFDTGEDEDYLNGPGGDIQKYREEPASSSSTTAASTTTSSTTPYPVDRKPSVQYFPPLQTSKSGSMNFGSDYAEIDFPKEVISLKPKATSPTYTENYHAKSGEAVALKPIKETTVTQRATTVPAPTSTESHRFTTQPPSTKALTEMTKPPAREDKQSMEFKRLYNNKQNDIGKNYYYYSHTTPTPYHDVHYEQHQRYTEDDDTFRSIFEVPQHPADIIKNKPRNGVKALPEISKGVSKFDDYPVVYNNTIVHQKAADGSRVVASSNAFFKQHVVGMTTSPRPPPPPPSPTPRQRLTIPQAPRTCFPFCDLTVELSPAYELHYYVPDQEERQEPEERHIDSLRNYVKTTPV